MKYTITKILFMLAFVLTAFMCSAQVPTVNHIPKNVSSKNWITNNSYGQTAYQVDRSIYQYEIYHNNQYIKVYYYYVYFYNMSYKKSNNQWMRVSTYIPSFTVTIDGINPGSNWMLVTGEFYYATYWSTNSSAKVSVTYSNPTPY